MQSAEDLAIAITGIDPDAYFPGCSKQIQVREILATYAAMIAARDAEWQARVDRLEAALKHIVEVEAKAHATGKYSLAVEWCADKARTALAESEAAHG